MRDGPCKTCGARRPGNYPAALFLQPVSQECFTCNHATVDEILRAGQARDRETYERARPRHYPPLARKRP